MESMNIIILTGRDRHQRQPLLSAGFHQGKNDHQKPKGSLGSKVPFVNPKPVVIVFHRGEGVFRFAQPTLYLDQLFQFLINTVGLHQRGNRTTIRYVFRGTSIWVARLTMICNVERVIMAIS